MADNELLDNLQGLYHSLQSVFEREDGAVTSRRMNSSSSDHRSPVVAASAAPPMKLSLPAILQNNDRGLDAVPTATLRKCLKPILDGLKTIDAEELLGLEEDPAGEGPCLRKSVSVRAIHDLVMPPCDEGTVRYIHLSEVEGQYSMGVFVFPPNSRIPLHDHPGMCVLSRVLYGDLKRESLDLARDQSPEEESEEEDDHKAAPTSWLSWSRLVPKRARNKDHTKRPIGSKLAYRKQVDHLEAPNCTMLFPYEGNLHEFVAGPKGAAVLDVLLPPYDHEHHRDCTFYQIQECTSMEKHDSSRQPVWIIPTEQPEDFHCISGSYEHLD